MNERCMIVLLKVRMGFVSQLSPRLLSRVKTGVLLGPLTKIASSTLISSDQASAQFAVGEDSRSTG